MECLELKRGEVLSRQGEDADRMFVVVYGRLRVVCRDADGTETVIAEAGRGDTVGRRQLADRRSAARHCLALRDSAVGVITRPLFENLKFQYPDVVARLSPHRLAAGPARAGRSVGGGLPRPSCRMP